MNQERKDRKEKPKWDAFHFRLPREKDQLKFIELYRRSGAKTKTDFIRHRILDEDFHVVMTDASKDNITGHSRSIWRNCINLAYCIIRLSEHSTATILLLLPRH